MTPKLKVYQAFDRALIAEIPADDAAVLEHKLDVAAKPMPIVAHGCPRIAGWLFSEGCPSFSRRTVNALPS